MNPETWAFIDEYGNPNLDTKKEGVSQFFIVSAAVVDSTALNDVRSQLERVRRGFFQTGKMKSQLLGQNRQRWLAVLSALSDVPFTFYGLVVDKRAIDPASGLQWKQSFYKNLCGRVYGKLMKAFPALHVRADRYGTDDFKKSFANYVRVNHRPTLFDRGTFDFVEGKDDVAVQLADILCGLLARCYDPEKRLSAPTELLHLVAEKALLVDEWPPRFRVTGGKSELGARDDARIAECSLQQAEDFVVNHEDDPSENVRSQVAVLERLLFERRLGEEAGHVSTAALIENLRGRGLEPKSESWFRMSVIAGLRDRGVLLTSSSTGYKLPTSPNDVVAYVRHAETVCLPMLRRVVAACDAVKLATKNEVDVLAAADHAVVKRLIDVLDLDSPPDDPSE